MSIEQALLEAFEHQIRREPGVVLPGWRTEWVSNALRTVAPPESARSGGILCTDFSDLTSDEVDARIAEHVAFFESLGRPWEWKLYGHDSPTDLPARLTAAGLVAEDVEALVIGEVDAVLSACAGSDSPVGVEIREATTAADFDGITDLNEAVWGRRDPDRTDELIAEKAADPDGLLVLVAVAEGRVVCASRVNFHAGTEFASLWGGGTLREWRGRGIYRAMVAARAEAARERGFRLLQVDASPDSRPILERLGLVVVSTTTPLVGGAAAAPVQEQEIGS